jgi:DNA-binding NarL/FixJ family response regulator
VPIPFPAHILIADDHAVVREGIKAMLEREPDLKVVAEAADGLEAVEQAMAPEVHLAILDVAMPALTGLQAAREIARRRPDLPILILSMYDREQYFFEALAAGASGYVLKREADQDIVEACRAALRGQPFIYPRIMSTLMQRYLERVERGERPGRGPLTPRETEIVKLIAEGHTSQEIAEMLVISPKTVERHRANVLEKLDMRDRVEVTRYAIREGLIEP